MIRIFLQLKSLIKRESWDKTWLYLDINNEMVK